MKRLSILFFFLTTVAFANQPVADQEYVMAAPTPQTTLQKPFDSQQHNNAANNASANTSQSPMNIYVRPESSQPQPQTNETQQQPYSEQPYQTTYGKIPNSQTPNNQATSQQSTQWQSRPATVTPQYQNQNSFHNSYPAQNPIQQHERNTAPINAHSTAPGNTSSTAPHSYRNLAPTNAPGNAASYAYPRTQTLNKNTAPSKENSPYNDTARAEWFKHCLAAVKTKQLAASMQAYCSCGWQKISNGGIKPSLFTSNNPADIQRANTILQNISQECLMEVVQGR